MDKCLDNDSTDDTCNYISTFFADVILIKQKSNIGFGQANNLGFEYALNNCYDYILLLNQDAYLESDTIEKLYKISKNHSHIGIWSPFHKNYNTINTEEYFKKYVLNYYTPNYNADFNNNKIKDFYESSFIHAACWFMPISTVKKVGGFDPLFFHYGEDNDYIQRINYYNLSIAFMPNSIFYHQGSNATMKSAETKIQVWLNESILKFKNPNASLIGAILLFFKNGVKFILCNNKPAKKAFIKNLSCLFEIIKSKKAQLKPFAYLNTLKDYCI